MESSIDILVFKWFGGGNENENEDLMPLACDFTVGMREMGNMSTRLLLVPIVFLTMSSMENVFWALLFGAGLVLNIFSFH